MDARLQYETQDSAEQVRKCLNCPLPVCVNCVENKHAIRDFDNLKIVNEMWWDGYTDFEIAEKLHKPSSAVRGYRQILGLKPQNPVGMRVGVRNG